MWAPAIHNRGLHAPGLAHVLHSHLTQFQPQFALKDGMRVNIRARKMGCP